MQQADIAQLPKIVSDALFRAVGEWNSGDLSAAGATFGKLLAQRVVHPIVAYAAAGFMMAKGDMARAWALYERRLNLSYYTHRPFAMLDRPYWDGAPMKDARLLIFADMGLGDTILMARFLPWAENQVGGLALQVNKGSANFWRHRFPAVAVSELGDPLPDCDVKLNIFCLPRLYGASPDTLPRAPYLSPRDGLRAEWRGRLGEGFNVGISWQGNPSHMRDNERSIPLGRFVRMAADPDLAAAGVNFYSLQVGDGREELVRMSSAVDDRFTDLGADIMASDDPLGASAALAAELDLVIAVDSTLANLCGAMGLNFWLPTYTQPEWRWCIYPSLDPAQPETAPWYGSQTPYPYHERWQVDASVLDMHNDLRARFGIPPFKVT
ncbi:MAG: hypothetical protein VW268_13955 [Rhodospirillaceae bacterium]